MHGLGLAACALTLSLLGACSGRDRTFWREGEAYAVRFMATHRTALTPEMQAAIPAHSDSVLLEFTVQYIRGDSIGGVYSGNIDTLGVIIGKTPLDSNRFSGTAHGDAFALMLAPRVRDGAMTLHGSIAADTATGEWSTQAPPSVTGTFVIKKK